MTVVIEAGMRKMRIDWSFARHRWSCAGLAFAPRILRGLGLQAVPGRVEAVLLIILVFIGVNVAWLLLFEEAPS